MSINSSVRTCKNWTLFLAAFFSVDRLNGRHRTEEDFGCYLRQWQSKCQYEATICVSFKATRSRARPTVVDPLQSVQFTNRN